MADFPKLEESALDIINLIKHAELDVVFMSGRGLGSILLSIIALVAIWRVTSSEALTGIVASIICSLVGKK